MNEPMKVPITIEEAVKQIINVKNEEGIEEEIKEWGESPEKEACARVHQFGGMNMRNDWGLWKGSALAIEFWARFRIGHADDMSGMLFTSAHREMNGKPWGLEAQAAHCIKFWAKQGTDVTPEWAKEQTISMKRVTQIKRDLFQRYYQLDYASYEKLAMDGAPESEQGTIWRLYGIAGSHVDEMINHMFLRIAELEDEAVSASETICDLRVRLENYDDGEA